MIDKLQERIAKLRVDWDIKPYTSKCWWEKEMLYAFEEGKAQRTKEVIEMINDDIELSDLGKDRLKKQLEDTK